MKITLINPPSPYLANDAAYPPLGLMYVASAFATEDIDVEILDMSGGIYNHKIICEIDSDAIGFTCVTPNYNIVKQLASLSTLPKLVGGSHCTATKLNPEELNCDAVIYGEVELVVGQIASDLKHNDIIGKRYFGGPANINNIKPNRDIVDLFRYSNGGVIQTSRGCPYRCKFCPVVGGNKWREISLDTVMEEVEELKSLGFEEIAFGDDNIAIDTHRLSDLLDRMSKTKLRFRLNMDARHIDRDLFKQAAASGCIMISCGIESGSQRILDYMAKDTTVEKNLAMLKLVSEFNMTPRGYLVVNFPGETHESITETVNFIKKSGCKSWLLSNFVPLPGTEPYTNPDKYGITWISNNWSQFYLVDRNGNSGECFLTSHLTFKQQMIYRKAIREAIYE